MRISKRMTVHKVIPQSELAAKVEAVSIMSLSTQASTVDQEK
jgi:hypothetical protein